MELFDKCSLISEPYRLPSRLFSINPVGIGSHLSESLTSFIGRLANAHCVHVGILMAEEIAPIMGKDYLRKIVNRGGKGYSDCAVGFNGIDTGAVDCVAAINHLTGRKDLKYLTLLALSNLFPTRGLLRSTRAWCPVCYCEWHLNNQVIYEPLIWYVKEVEVCFMHLVPLVSNCPNSKCDHPQPILNRYTRPGYCFKCGEWLGLEYKILELDSNHHFTIWQLFKSYCIGELIEYSSNKDEIIVDIPNQLRAYVRQITNGNVAAFARIANIPKVTFWDWYAGKNLPTLGGLLNICFCLGITLVQFLLDPPKPIIHQSINSSFIQRNGKRPRQRSSFDKSAVEQYLVSVLDSDTEPAPSMLRVANRLGYHRKQLYKYFPKLCRDISLRYQKYVKQQRKMRIDNTSLEVDEAIRRIINSGRYPTRKVVESEINKPGALKEMQIRAAWRKSLQNNGIH
ncbi:TniQ family protein [Brevibacillus porteri]|uniref:TniQ family protein n=1 Tax=Brevibacillus porteri TaxID=2126350 RepID=UPI00370A062E